MQPNHHRINHTPMYFNGLFYTVTLVSTNFALPGDGVTLTPKHVGAVLM